MTSYPKMGIYGKIYDGPDALIANKLLELYSQKSKKYNILAFLGHLGWLCN